MGSVTIPDFIFIISLFALSFYSILNLNIYLYMHTSLKHQPKAMQEIVKNLVFGGNSKFWPVSFWILTPLIFAVYRFFGKKIQVIDISSFDFIAKLLVYIQPGKTFLSVAPQYNFVVILSLFCVFVGFVNLCYEKFFAFKTIDITRNSITENITNNKKEQVVQTPPKPLYKGLD